MQADTSMMNVSFHAIRLGALTSVVRSKDEFLSYKRLKDIPNDEILVMSSSLVGSIGSGTLTRRITSDIDNQPLSITDVVREVLYIPNPSSALRQPHVIHLAGLRGSVGDGFRMSPVSALSATDIRGCCI